MHRGQSLVVWAIREGREAAREVDDQSDGIHEYVCAVNDYVSEQNWKIR